MINYEKKNITTVTRGIIAHGVNCLGVMGSGIALAIKTKWPKAFIEYQELCKKYSPIELLGLTQVIHMNGDLYVSNNFTQLSCGHIGRYADPEAVKMTLGQTFSFADSIDLPLFLPKIGCGLGGLLWEGEIEPIVKELIRDYPNIEVTVVDL